MSKGCCVLCCRCCCWCCWLSLSLVRSCARLSLSSLSLSLSIALSPSLCCGCCSLGWPSCLRHTRARGGCPWSTREGALLACLLAGKRALLALIREREARD